MTRISEEIRISVPKQVVWEAISDLAAVQDFNPSVKRSYYRPGPRKGISAGRHCDLIPLGSVEETVTEWKEGEGFTLKIHDGKNTPPWKRATGRMWVLPEGAGARAGLSVEYELKFGLVGALMDRLLVRPQFRKTVRNTLEGLKKRLENKFSSSFLTF